MRDDLRLVPLAEELGYKVDRKRDQHLLVDGKLPTYIGENGKTRLSCTGDSYSFAKGEQRIWFCSKGWACADLIEGYYRNHRYYPWLEMALRIEASADKITSCPKCGAKNPKESCDPRCTDCPMTLCDKWSESMVWLNIKNICPDMIAG